MRVEQARRRGGWIELGGRRGGDQDDGGLEEAVDRHRQQMRGGRRDGAFAVLLGVEAVVDRVQAVLEREDREEEAQSQDERARRG